jgi:hypothetical protein
VVVRILPIVYRSVHTQSVDHFAKYQTLCKPHPQKLASRVVWGEG